MTDKSLITSLPELLAPMAEQTDADLERWLIEDAAPVELAEAMRYCVMGGKRLRPALVHLAADAVGRGGNAELVRRAAVAVELIHVYSLVHDDLPAMDDDDLRRGRATAHVKFGEAMAILVGDALQTRAFGLLVESGEVRSVQLVAELASAAGATGMVAGQVADMDLCRLPAGLDGLKYIHTRKTGAMLRAAARMGAIAAAASDTERMAITRYAETLGLAFQLYDDLLDATGTAEQIGKTPGKDAQTGKRTYVTELGIESARQLGRELTAQAIDALAPLARRGEALRMLAEYLAERTH